MCRRLPFHGYWLIGLSMCYWVARIVLADCGGQIMNGVVMPTIVIRLCEDVVGIEGVWRAGELRTVPIDKAAEWIRQGAAVAAMGKELQTVGGHPQIETTVTLPYVTPEGRGYPVC